MSLGICHTCGGLFSTIAGEQFAGTPCRCVIEGDERELVPRLKRENADLKAKLAHVEADAAVMRQVLEEVAEYEADEAPCIASDAKAALATGSGQRLLDELAELRRDWVEIKSELALSTKTDDEKPIVTIRGLESEIYTLRETAQRRLELLKKVEWDVSDDDGTILCFYCRNWKSDGHKPDCPLAKELEAK